MKKHRSNHPESQSVTLGRNPKAHHGVVNIPPYRSSTVTFETVEDFHAAAKGKGTRSYYGRYGTPTTQALEEAVASLEGADSACITSSGVSAMTLAILSFVSQGEHLLMADGVYGPTRELADSLLKRFGIETSYFDPRIGTDIERLFRPETKAVFLESPSSLTMEMSDIPAIAAVAHARNAVVIADTTWFGCLLARPFELGIDVSAQSLTKYVSGHSDLVMGSVSAKTTHFPQILHTHRLLGGCSNPEDAYLALRGLRTLPLRLKQHAQNGLIVAEWFRARPEVEAILCPFLPESPDYAVWRRDCTGGNGLFSVVFKPEFSKQDVARFLESLNHICIGVSWGGYESLAIPFDPRPVRTASEWPYQGACARFHIGLEHPDDVIADLDQALVYLRQPRILAAS